MSKLRSGFTLIEFIVYCAASVTLIMAFMYYASTTHMRFKQLNKKSLNILSFYGAIQHCISILEIAPPNSTAWKRRTATEIIYTHNNQDIGWCAVDNRFVYILGTYAMAQQRWVSKKTYPLINNIQSCNFALKNSPNNQIQSITLTLKSIEKEQTTCVIDLKLYTKPLSKIVTTDIKQQT